MHFKKYPSFHFWKFWSGARIKMIADTRQFWSVVYVQLSFLRSYDIQNNNNNINRNESAVYLIQVVYHTSNTVLVLFSVA